MTTADQDRALARLQIEAVVSLDSIETVTELNAFASLTKLGKARFARFGKNSGYVAMGRSFLREVR